MTCRVESEKAGNQFFRMWLRFLTHRSISRFFLMNKIYLQRFWLLKILRNVKITSKYCILLLKRFKTWLFSDPSCWSELARDWDPPNTTQWRRLTKFESSSQLLAMMYVLPCVLLSRHNYVTGSPWNFLDFVSIMSYRIFTHFYDSWRIFLWSYNWCLFLELSVASPSYWDNSDYPYSFPRLCGPKM